jgi:hypothetical protein
MGLISNKPSTAIVEKARRLQVLSVSPYMALVVSGKAIYFVRFRPLACSCAAGLVGQRCSHLIAAVARRHECAVEDVEV